MTKLKKKSNFPYFSKNAWVVDFGSLPRDEKMVDMDQLGKKALVKGYILTSWKFQTK